MVSFEIPAATVRRARLWAEFVLLYVGGPLAVTSLFGHRLIVLLVAGLAAFALAVLALTPSVSLRAVLRLPTRAEWLLVAATWAATFALSVTLAWLLVPERLLGLPLHAPALWALILLIYPVLSALPQEVVFRVLFFERYGVLFGNERLAVLANGVAFALAHLFYLNPVAVALSLLGGLLFGFAYLRTRSLMVVALLHAAAGQAIFTSGLGIYFYHGAIGHTP